MNIKELKELIENLPDDMPFGLLDSSTDDEGDMNYLVTPDSFIIEDYYDPEDLTEAKGKALFLTFDNKLNENPINA